MRRYIKNISIVLLSVLAVLIHLPSVQAEESDADTSSTKEKKLGFKDMVEISGQFNASYNYNFNNPTPSVTNMRVFDGPANDFTFHLVDLVITVAPTDYLTFRADVDAGEDVAVVDGVQGGIIGVDEFGLQQAFVEATAPLGNGLTFKMGHFVTLLGHEVIESASNWNTSRSLLFGFAIPFTHTGLLITYPWSDRVSTTLGVINGWDVVTDNNKGKSLIGQVLVKPTDDLTMSLQGIYGAEQTGSDGNMRGIVDFVLDWNVTDCLTLGFNYDWGREEGVGGHGLANWQGAALYAHWKPTEHFGTTFRGEWFQDDGSRQTACSGVACTSLDMFEATATFHYYILKNLEARLEVRHDHADKAIFAKSNGTLRRFADTASVELLYSF